MTSNRARKTGDAYYTEQKLEKKYDEEDQLGTPKAIVDWIAASLGSDVQPIGGYTWEDIQQYLKDGVVICKLINEMLSQAGKPKVKFQKNAKTAFVAMGNIQVFNDGCRAYGVPETALFQTADLYEGRKAQMVNVINCLSKLGFTGNSNGFTPTFSPPAAPKLDWSRDDD